MGLEPCTGWLRQRWQWGKGYEALEYQWRELAAPWRVPVLALVAFRDTTNGCWIEMRLDCPGSLAEFQGRGVLSGLIIEARGAVITTRGLEAMPDANVVTKLWQAFRDFEEYREKNSGGASQGSNARFRDRQEYFQFLRAMRSQGQPLTEERIAKAAGIGGDNPDDQRKTIRRIERRQLGFSDHNEVLAAL